MLYIATSTLHAHLTQDQRKAAFGRRAEWKPPANMKIVGEWWSPSAPNGVMILETDSLDPIYQIVAAFGDVYEIKFTPAATPDQVLKMMTG